MRGTALKSVVLTGAAGGIGKAAVRHLVREGYRVYAGYMDDWEAQQLETLKQELRTDLLTPVALDVRDAGQIESAIRQVEREGTTLMALIGNGGACPLAIPVEHTDFAITRDVYETNLIGNAALVKRALPLLKRSKGRIILVGSLWGLVVGPHLMSYTASKHALEALAACSRRELAQFGIQVAMINPGVVKNTYMTGQQIEQSKEFLLSIGTPADQVSSKTYDKGGNTRLLHPTPVPDENYNGGYRGLNWMLAMAIDPDKMKMICSADDCARFIMKALRAARPRVRYIVGWDAKLLVFLARLLPERMMDKVIVAISSK